MHLWMEALRQTSLTWDSAKVSAGHGLVWLHPELDRKQKADGNNDLAYGIFSRFVASEFTFISGICVAED